MISLTQIESGLIINQTSNYYVKSDSDSQHQTQQRIFLCVHKMMLGDMCTFVSYQKQMICEEGLNTQGLMKTQFLILSLMVSTFMVSVLLCKKKKKKIEITEPEQNTAKTKSKRFLLRNMIRMYRNSGLVSYTSQRLLISK